LRAFAANANCDSDENGARIDNLDAAYIKMFDTQYNKICDELENNNQQLDKVYTTLLIWRNCGILQ